MSPTSANRKGNDMFGRKQGREESKVMEQAPRAVEPTKREQREAPKDKYTVPWAPASQSKMMDAAIGSFEWHAYKVASFMKQSANRQRLDQVGSEMGCSLDRVYVMLMEESRLFMPRHAGSVLPPDLETQWLVHMEHFVDWMLFLYKSSQAAFPPPATTNPAAKIARRAAPQQAPQPVQAKEPESTVARLMKEKMMDSVIENVVLHNVDTVNLLSDMVGPEGVVEGLRGEYAKAINLINTNSTPELTVQEAESIMVYRLGVWLQENLAVLQGISAGVEAADADSAI